MTQQVFHEATGIKFLVIPINYRRFPGATTLTGGAVQVNAFNVIQPALKYVGVATLVTVEGVQGISCKFANWAVPEGTYKIDVDAAPAGYDMDTIKTFTATVKKSAAPAP